MTRFATAQTATRHTARLAGAMVAVLGFALLVPLTATAESVDVTVDRTHISLGETVTLNIVLEGKFDDTTGPEIPDFEVVGRSSGSSVSIVNGVVTRSQQVVLRLAPLRTGALQIGPIEARRDGRVVTGSKAITVQVTDGGQTPPPAVPPESPEPSADIAPPTEPVPATPGNIVPDRLAGRQAFVIARTPDRTLYAGEPFYTEYVLYTRSDLPLTGLRMETAPRLQQFVVQQGTADAEQVTRTRVGGRTFDTRVLWRGALSALAPGRAVIDSLQLTLITGDFFGRRQTSIKSDPIALTFQTPPAEGRPADYVEGTLGQFVIKATADRDTIRVGESALLTVEVTGTGNLRAIQPPKVPTPNGLRIASVPSTDLDEVVFDLGGVSGRRVFQYLLTGESEGVKQVGRIELPFFNTISERYERARTEPFEVLVTAWDAGPIRHAGPSGHEPTTAIATSVPALEAVPPGEVAKTAPAMRTWIFAGMTVPVVFFLGAEFAVRRRRRQAERGESIARKRAMGHAGKALDAIERRERRQPSPDFWNALDYTIRGFLEARFQIATTGMTRAELRTALIDRSGSEAAIDAVLDELEACAFARFAPSAAQDQDRHDALARVHASLATLDRAQAGRGGR